MIASAFNCTIRSARILAAVVLTALPGVVALATPAAAKGQTDKTLARHEFAQVHMGVPFKIVLYAHEPGIANRATKAAFAEIERLNGIFSDYYPKSELSRLSRSSPSKRGVKVSDPLWEILRRADRLARQTDGAFDVTVGPVVKLWRRARRRKALPEPERLRHARQSVGYRHMALDAKERTIQLMRPDMRLDLGGIAKGYAADAALAVLAKHGIRRALVDASGDVAIGAPPPHRSGWRIAVTRLDPKAKQPSRYLLLANCAVATSGDAFQHLEINGRRYSHILDPRTGIGLTTPSSVTVIAPDAVTADSLASAVSVLGPKTGLKLVKSRKQVETLIVRRVAGQVKAVESGGFAKHLAK